MNPYRETKRFSQVRNSSWSVSSRSVNRSRAASSSAYSFAYVPLPDAAK
ncbi:MAG: hypothetical protein HYU54_08910 [Actinobacteria bacterium]|nr:hypothetical protein [Actinomycetota bacterium]